MDVQSAAHDARPAWTVTGATRHGLPDSHGVPVARGTVRTPAQPAVQAHGPVSPPVAVSVCRAPPGPTGPSPVPPPPPLACRAVHGVPRPPTHRPRPPWGESPLARRAPWPASLPRALGRTGAAAGRRSPHPLAALVDPRMAAARRVGLRGARGGVPSAHQPGGAGSMVPRTQTAACVRQSMRPCARAGGRAMRPASQPRARARQRRPEAGGEAGSA